MSDVSLEQQARDLLERLGHPDAQSMSAGDLVEIANLMGQCRRAISVLQSIDALLKRPERLPGCIDCGMPYADFPLDVILPRSQWLAIHPAENGLLCAFCIVARASKLPGATCCHLIIEVAPWRSQ